MSFMCAGLHVLVVVSGGLVFPPTVGNLEIELRSTSLHSKCFCGAFSLTRGDLLLREDSNGN